MTDITTPDITFQMLWEVLWLMLHSDLLRLLLLLLLRGLHGFTP